MNTRKIPAVSMLSAGLITLIIIHVRELRMSVNDILITLLIVLLSFYVIGVLIKMVADLNIRKIEALEQEEEELRQAEELEAQESQEEVDEQEAK